MKLAKTHVYSARDSIFFSDRVINIWNALRDSIVNLRPSTALNPKLVAFISVIFVLIVLFGYIFNLFLGRGMLVQASAFGSWLHRLPHVFMFFSCLYFLNFLLVFCDLVYLINLISFDLKLFSS